MEQRISLTKAKHGDDIDAFMTKFNPDLQLEVCKEPRLCYLGDFPTLGFLVRAYGTESAKMWLLPQLSNLSEFSGARTKLEDRQLEECVSIIADEFNYLKVTEMMLFCYRFKNGRYGRFYGSVDPMMINESIYKFLKERNVFFDRYYQEIEDRRLEAQKEDCIPYEEYLRRKAEREKK